VEEKLKLSHSGNLLQGIGMKTWPFLLQLYCIYWVQMQTKHSAIYEELSNEYIKVNTSIVQKLK